MTLTGADAEELTTKAKRLQRELTLEVGTPGRLLLAEEIAKVLPFEDAKALREANPVQGGKLVPNAAKIEARRKAMVARLPKAGLSVIMLGGSHDLGKHLGYDVLYFASPREIIQRSNADTHRQSSIPLQRDELYCGSADKIAGVNCIAKPQRCNDATMSQERPCDELGHPCLIGRFGQRCPCPGVVNAFPDR